MADTWIDKELDGDDLVHTPWDETIKSSIMDTVGFANHILETFPYRTVVRLRLEDQLELEMKEHTDART